MLDRTTLLACPSCARHVLVSTAVCPACGGAIRAADGSVARTPVAVMMGLGAVLSLTGCGSTVLVEDGSGGSGGAGVSSVTSTTGSSKSTTKGSSVAQTTTMAVSTYGVGPSSTTSTFVCDDGTFGTVDSQLCSDCVGCALGASCADEYAAYQADPNAGAFDACISECVEARCFDECIAAYPSAYDAYVAALSCAICVECPNNCDAANTCA
jgi:hypothetical protein